MELETACRTRQDRISELNKEVENNEALLTSTMETMSRLGLSDTAENEELKESTTKKLMELKKTTNRSSNFEDKLGGTLQRSRFRKAGV